MARKVETLTITGEGRDTGKVFTITEMPATVAKKWVTRLLREMAQRANNDQLQAAAEMAALLDDPAFEQWRECVAFAPSGVMPQKIQWDRPDCQIEEIDTVTLLQVKVLEVHIGFFTQGNP